jgi:Mg-chelatase subunit ChlD
MEDCRDKTIDAFNEYVNSLRHQSQAGTRLSLTTFDSESIDLVIDALKIADVPKLTRETFVPRGMTPLFDAVANVVAVADKVTLLPDERVALSILTDGLENSESVKKLLLDRQERCNWLVQYLGANQDAWSVGATMGIAAAHSMDYATASMSPAMQSMASSVGRYRSAKVVEARSKARFTPEERAAAKGDKA